MDITPHELRDLDIPESFRGYNRDDVNDLLERAATTIEDQLNKIGVLTERVSSATADVGRTRDNDDILQRTLIMAQRAADDAVDTANRDAEATRASAQAEASEIRATAAAQAEAFLAQAHEELQRYNDQERGRVEREVVDLMGRRDALLADVSALEAWDADYRDRLVRQLESDLNSARKRPAVSTIATPSISDVRVDDLGGAASVSAPRTPDTEAFAVEPIAQVATTAPAPSLQASGPADVAAGANAAFEISYTPAPESATAPLVGSAQPSASETLAPVVASIAEPVEAILERPAAAPPSAPPAPQALQPAAAEPSARASYLDQVMSAPERRPQSDIDLRATEADRANLDDDAFFATLRDAVRDDAPLGESTGQREAVDDRDPSFREMFKRRR